MRFFFRQIGGFYRLVQSVDSIDSLNNSLRECFEYKSNETNFILDNTPPTIKIVSKPRLNSSNPSIQWSSDEDVTFRCSLDYRDFFNCGRGTIGFWTGDNLPQGLHTFVIEGKDEMKNTGRHTYKWTQGMTTYSQWRSKSLDKCLRKQKYADKNTAILVN